MTHRLLAVVLLFALAAHSLAPRTYAAGDASASAEEVYEDLRTHQVDTSDRDAALNAMRQAVKADQENAQWRAGLALALAAAEEWKDARDEAEAAVELAPDIAEYHVIQADVIFQGIDDASLFAKGRLASQGRKAYERAVELDPNNMSARIGLANFYIFAPGIAGGSLAKGMEHAEALVDIEGAQSQGYILLAQIAMKRDDWSAFDQAIADALEASDSPEAQLNVIRSLGIALVFQEKKYDRAAALVAAHDDLVASDSTSLYIWGVSLHEQDRYAEAADVLERVIAVKSDAVNSRFRLAQCYEELERWADAERLYQEYVDMFPDGSDAKTAKKGVKRMQKKQR